MHLAEVSTFGMFAVLGTALALPRFFPSTVVLFPYLVVLGLGVGCLNVVLPLVVRCRVCGLRVNGCEEALRFSRGDRLLWVYALQTCPRCRDNGLALPDAREAWKQEPWAPSAMFQPAYWNRRRMTIAALAMIGLLVVVELAGRYRVGPR
jgi:hypothetical protein